MKKKKKLNKKKLIPRLILLIVILVVIILLIKGIFAKDNSSEELRLIVDKQDVTENLISDIYIDTNGTLYMSMEDIKNIFDENIFYEETSGKIITTYGTKVAAIDVDDNTEELNSATLSLTAGIIKYDTGYYIPISELTNVYNIEVTTTENASVVLSMYKELTTVKTTKRVSLKEKTSFFSSTIQKIDEGEEVIFIENAEKSGWIKVLTYEGNIGYIQEKNTTDKETKRTNMEDSDFSSKDADINNAIEITNETIKADNLQNFDSRKEVIEEIILDVIAKEQYTVNLNLENVNLDTTYLERFVIELIPRLREIGGSVLITNNNNNILSNEFVSKFSLEGE